MKYKGKELHEYSKDELIAILKDLLGQRIKQPDGNISVTFYDSDGNEVDPFGIYDTDTISWSPPKRVSQQYRGKGEAGGK